MIGLTTFQVLATHQRMVRASSDWVKTRFHDQHRCDSSTDGTGFYIKLEGPRVVHHFDAVVNRATSFDSSTDGTGMVWYAAKHWCGRLISNGTGLHLYLLWYLNNVTSFDSSMEGKGMLRSNVIQERDRPRLTFIKIFPFDQYNYYEIPLPDSLLS